MANHDHIAQLKKGVAAWNTWREKNRDTRLDLSGADLSKLNLSEANLSGADLTEANLCEANLSGANLSEVNLRRADLRHANLSGADLHRAQLERANIGPVNQNPGAYHRQDLELVPANLEEANLEGAYLNEAFLYLARLHRANLQGAKLSKADLREAILSEANLRHADFSRADLTSASLSGADLSGATLEGANFHQANLGGANLSEANLESAALLNTDLTGADLTGCRIYGVSAWGLKLDKAKQQNLLITPSFEPQLIVDNVEVAQFIYLMLNNEKVRDVIDAITSKAVLILGRFTDERKAVLDALREELRKRNYLPILFDFEVPEKRNVTETVTLLARMARFIIADLTDPRSIPQELQAIIPSVRVPVQPLLLEGSSLYSMFRDFDPQDFHWVLPVYRYKEPEQLLKMLSEKVIAPAEGKVEALAERRRTIEAELNKPQ